MKFKVRVKLILALRRLSIGFALVGAPLTLFFPNRYVIGATLCCLWITTAVNWVELSVLAMGCESMLDFILGFANQMGVPSFNPPPTRSQKINEA